MSKHKPFTLPKQPSGQPFGVASFGTEAAAKWVGSVALWLPVWVALGILATSLLPPMPWAKAASILGCVLLSALCSWRWWRYSLQGLWVLTILVGLIGGFTLMSYRTQTNTTRQLSTKLFNVPITGKIDYFERNGTSGWRIVLSNVALQGQTYRVRITTRRKDFVPVLGSIISTRASFMPPSPPIVPNSFNFKRHAFYQRLSGYGYSVAPIVVVQPAPPTIQNPLFNFRQSLGAQIVTVLQTHGFKPDIIGISVALINGDQATIPKSTNTMLQQSGLAHFISISGVHIGLMAAFIFALVRIMLVLHPRTALFWPNKKIAAIVACIIIWLYMAIVGADAPTLRSVLMTSLILLAVLVDREAITLRLVSIAALGLLLLRPESALQPGFQMSFMAVLGLTAFYQSTKAFWQKPWWHEHKLGRISLWLAGALLTSTIAGLATLPIALYHFQQLPIYAAAANLLAMPLMGLTVMPLTLLIYALAPFNLATWPIVGLGYSIKYFVAIGAWVATWPHVLWRFAGLNWWLTLAMVAGLCVLCFVQHRARWLGLLAFCGALIYASLQPLPQLYLLQGGQGLAWFDRPTKTLWVHGRMDKFLQQVLQQQAQANVVKVWDFEHTPPDWQCDNTTGVCYTLVGGKKLVALTNLDVVKLGCAGLDLQKPDILVSRFWLKRNCVAKKIIDRDQLQDSGWVGF